MFGPYERTDTMPKNKLGTVLTGNDNSNVLTGGDRDDFLFGRGGNDFLTGGRGNDLISGGAGNNIAPVDDVLTGGRGKDTFLFNADDLGQTPNITLNGITGSNTPDQITDFNRHEDRVALDQSDFGVLGKLDFANATVANLTGDANVVVLQDSFNNGFQAAAAIRDQDNFTGDAGFFVYFNKNLGFYRVVHSEDLDDGGNITVLANLPGQDLDDGPKFQANDFVFV